MFTTSKNRLSISIIFNKSNTFGLLHDAELIKKSLSEYADVNFIDPLEVPTPCDINIHLEVPYYVYVPWSTYNIFVMNPEWYIKQSWEPYMKHFDLVITKENLNIENSYVLPWSILPLSKVNVEHTKEFLYLLGNSKNKRDFAKLLLPSWKETYPNIHVYSVEPLELNNLSSNVKLYTEDLSKEKRQQLLHKHSGHVCCSMAEGFGYTAAEANYVNAFTILNTLPVYKEYYNNSQNKHWIETTFTSSEKYVYGTFVDTILNIEQTLDLAIEEFSSNYVSNYIEKSTDNFKINLLQILDKLQHKTKIKYLPPLLDRKECPNISVITLLYNRRKFFDLAKHNMILTDYPKDKIQWVIVEDSDDINEQASDKIIQTSEQFTGMDIHYVPLLKRTPVSQKRNIGVEHCTNDIVLFMDDDDHYPETSFRRRVAWLTKHPMKPKATVCSTIACYDLVKGVSAVNSPPFELPLGQRISEATLTFYKSWYLTQKMEINIQVGEGETLIKNREHEVLEMPPQQVIVAFSHSKNTSSRRIPSAENVTPSCFWGFPKEYLKFIHSLAGIQVV
jgi:hypothetical protein